MKSKTPSPANRGLLYEALLWIEKHVLGKPSYKRPPDSYPQGKAPSDK
jgi:hypothetical protein